MEISWIASSHSYFYMVLFMVTFLSAPKLTSSGATQLTTANLQEILTNYELVFVNFYADWCRFSQMLQPVYDEAAGKINEEFKDPGTVVFAKVDCDNQPTISQQYKVSKYPTLKLIRHGQALKREYRGQRSSEALQQFIREQLKDPIKYHDSLDQLDNIDNKKRNIIGYFASQDSENYKTYKKVASVLRDDCEFHSAIGPVSEKERTNGDAVLYRPPNSERNDQAYSGPLTTYDSMHKWALESCVPLVREITFENAEELTEEGLPFLILFYNPLADQETLKKFTDSVAHQLQTEKGNINCLTADGTKFTHPLYHLGKSVNDLPLLAIDSFRHMYIFKHDVRKDMSTPTLLLDFIKDLHSGKLHREFHHGPDTEKATEPPKLADGSEHIPKDTDDEGKKGGDDATTPPESTFKKLGPSRNRYTLLRDEL
ncbi:endoplasmic reticulum resident protein 44-like [Lineus longissimus]|uniref:endoplasmic reticulum resident protein 44-like n=1 Tax=Lineus longissimus TaxID=88925 RepID=UPI002B4CA10F